jgi:hypothetical protein
MTAAGVVVLAVVRKAGCSQSGAYGKGFTADFDS